MVASGRRLAAESRSGEHICRAACRAAHQLPIHQPPIWVRVRVTPSLILTLSLTLSVLGYPIPEQPKVRCLTSHSPRSPAEPTASSVGWVRGGLDTAVGACNQMVIRSACEVAGRQMVLR